MCPRLQPYVPQAATLFAPRSVSEAHGRLEYARDVATAFEAHIYIYICACACACASACMCMLHMHMRMHTYTTLTRDRG